MHRYISQRKQNLIENYVVRMRNVEQITRLPSNDSNCEIVPNDAIYVCFCHLRIRSKLEHQIDTN